MLGKTAGGLYWMFRYLERCENTARLLDAGFHMTQARSKPDEDEWLSVLTTSGVRKQYEQRNSEVDGLSVIDFLLVDRENPSSVISSIDAARVNARFVRTAITREVWEATNECWLTLTRILGVTVQTKDLPQVLSTIRQQTALVCGALYGTMLRNDIFDFAQIGTYLERADNTARILDVKYYVLLPSAWQVGSSLDNVQWEMILRSVSAYRSYRWISGGDARPMGIADFLIFDRRVPRSLAFCYKQITEHLGYLEGAYGARLESHMLAENVRDRLNDLSIDSAVELGLHEFLGGFIRDNSALAQRIENDYRFYA